MSDVNLSDSAFNCFILLIEGLEMGDFSSVQPEKKKLYIQKYIPIRYTYILLSRISWNSNVCKHCLVRALPGLLIFPIQYHFLNHCIGALPYIALFSRSAQLPIKHFHLSNQRIYIHCSLLQVSVKSFDHLANSNLLFVPIVKINVGTRAFSIAVPTLWNSSPVSVKYVGNITTFCRKLKTCLNLRILHSSSAYQSNCLQLELLIDY